MPETTHSESIRKVCVIGAGTMGAGIAAQVANAGVPVLLLDIVRDPANRNAVAQGALDRLAKAEPAAFMSKRAAKLVEVGNIEDDLPRVAECDWVIEAIVERLDLKHALYEKLEGVRRPGTAVSSNTSTIPLEQLIAGRGEGFARDFLITHFFNPPRYMRLLEVVAGPASDAALVAKVSDFADRALGKTVVRAKDTPGFLANRVGTFWIQQAINAAIDLGLSVEEADAVVGKPMGVPKTGVFGLVDLVGIDLMPHLKASLTATLPQDDAYRAIAIDHPLIMKMIADGYTGRKGKGGFYRLNREAGKRKEAIDLATGEYRAAAKPPSLPGAVFKDLKALVGLPGKLGAYAWAVLAPTLSYAASLVPSASDDIVAIDVAMKLGYNWKSGPFELIDKLGTASSAGFPQQIEYADPRVVRATLGSFVSNFRSVTPDAVVQKQYIDRTYGLLRTSDPATEKVNAWFRSNSPFEKAKTATVAVEVNNIVALSNQSYQLDWTEFERDRRGKETATRRFRGIATVTLTPPQDEGVIRLNPIGLYVRDFDWTAQL